MMLVPEGIPEEWTNARRLALRHVAEAYGGSNVISMLFVTHPLWDSGRFDVRMIVEPEVAEEFLREARGGRIPEVRASLAEACLPEGLNLALVRMEGVRGAGDLGVLVASFEISNC